MILNIGLEASPKMGGAVKKLNFGEVLKELEKLTKVGKFKIEQSATEPTLVVETGKLSKEDIEELADKLYQEAIAAVDDSGDGFLAGRFKNLWGDFNPQYFISF